MMMFKSVAVFFLGLGILSGFHGIKSLEGQANKPNIVVIYMDDLGYGDVSSYGQQTLVTPNIDSLANGGIRFTNGYATSATCTPSRYAFLTGIYPWRNKDARILPGNAPLLIDTTLVTLPKMLQNAGYTTGIVGKWHLGIGSGSLDWNNELTGNPNDVGFGYSYIMAATTDRTPTVYIENRRIDGLRADDPIYVNYQKNFDGEPTALSNPELVTKQKWHHGHNNSVHNGISRIGFQKGGKSALWHDEDMAMVFVDKAKEFLDKNDPKATGKPFFMYLALHQPHVPRVPNERFVGKSGMGPRGDSILEADWCVGEIMAKLRALGLEENTMVVFSSDNGPVLNDGYYDDAVEKNGSHRPAGALRGGKYSLFQAGTRVPFITYWKGTIKPKVSDALICQMDLLASFADLAGQKNPSADSQNFLKTLLGTSDDGRKELVLEASGKLAYRTGDFSFIPPYKGNPRVESVNIETGVSPEYQLYNVKMDVSETNNLAKTMPKKVEELKAMMKKIVGNAYDFDTKEVELK